MTSPRILFFDEDQRATAKRVFEDTMLRTLQRYGPPLEAGTVECVIEGPEGSRVVIARYTVYPDGRLCEEP
jgi:hypothetical protein